MRHLPLTHTVSLANEINPVSTTSSGCHEVRYLQYSDRHFALVLGEWGVGEVVSHLRRPKVHALGRAKTLAIDIFVSLGNPASDVPAIIH